MDTFTNGFSFITMLLFRVLPLLTTVLCHPMLPKSNLTCSNNVYVRTQLFGFKCGTDEHSYYDDCRLSNETKTENMTKQLLTRHPSDELQTTDREPPIAPFEDWAMLKIQEQSKIKSTDHVTTPKVAIETVGDINEPFKPARNYASKECGAKILASNPEAQHISAVLNEKELDEYMLNPCQTEKPKFFVVELCESVQMARFELANFELFSSNIKQFRLFAAERYPSPEWILLGQFTANDARQLHGFTLDEQQKFYAKYIKVELLSHYGDEHFCSLTLIRVLGVSMVEEYENDAAASAVANSPTSHEFHPIQLILTQNVSAENKTLDQSVSSSLPESTSQTGGDQAVNVTGSAHANLTHSSNNGTVNSTKESTTANNNSTGTPVEQKTAGGKDYLESAKQVVLSVAKEVYGKVFSSRSQDETTDAASHGWDSTEQKGSDVVVADNVKEAKIIGNVSHFNQNALVSNGTLNESTSHNKSIANQTVQPTDKTIRSTTISLPPVSSKKRETNSVSCQQCLPGQSTPRRCALFINFRTTMLTTNDTSASERNETTVSPEKVEGTDGNSTLAPLSIALPPAHGQRPPPSRHQILLPGIAGGNKESVFFRVNNRIKSLEVNISLSQQYLSELSKKYRRQMEDIQRAFNATSRLFSETDQKFEQKLEQQAGDLKNLQHDLDKVKLLAEMVADKYAAQCDHSQIVGSFIVAFFVVNFIVMVIFWRILIRFKRRMNSELETIIEKCVEERLAIVRRSEHVASSDIVPCEDAAAVAESHIINNAVRGNKRKRHKKKHQPNRDIAVEVVKDIKPGENTSKEKFHQTIPCTKSERPYRSCTPLYLYPLTKLFNAFHLLRSPLNSLKSEED